jgi:hypothetical protein
MARLQCWHCGAAIPQQVRPIRRLTECPGCHADLHCCRMCRSWDPKVLGECTHDRAERVLEKEHGNFCTHFRPRTRAFQAAERDARNAGSDALHALFGVDAAAAPPGGAAAAELFGSGAPAPAQVSDGTRARRALDELFRPAQDESES